MEGVAEAIGGRADVVHIPIWVSLLLIAVILAIALATSLLGERSRSFFGEHFDN